MAASTGSLGTPHVKRRGSVAGLYVPKRRNGEQQARAAVFMKSLV